MLWWKCTLIFVPDFILPAKCHRQRRFHFYHHHCLFFPHLFKQKRLVRSVASIQWFVVLWGSFDHRWKIIFGSFSLKCAPRSPQRPPHTSCDPWPLLRIDWHSCHSVSMEAFQLISNPAGHQLGCVSVPNHPFQPSLLFPFKWYWFCPFIFIRVYHIGGLLLLWSHLSLCLTFPERSMHISMRQHLWKTEWGAPRGQRVG